VTINTANGEFAQSNSAQPNCPARVAGSAVDLERSWSPEDAGSEVATLPTTGLHALYWALSLHGKTFRRLGASRFDLRQTIKLYSASFANDSNQMISNLGRLEDGSRQNVSASKGKAIVLLDHLRV
jgi:hypothetical protein